MTLTRVPAAIALACALSIAAAAQSPARDARASTTATEPTGRGSIAGIVVSGDASARPLRLASVVLVGLSTGTLRVTMTNADGRFEVTGLPADRYQVGASKAPYLGAVAGAKRPAHPGAPVALADGQRMTGVTIRLPPAGAITGTITDEHGQPAAGAFVGVQQARMQGGQRVLVEIESVVLTDDRGRYRIYGLTPGEYAVISVRSGGVAGSGVLALSDADVDRAIKSGTAAVAAAAPPDPVKYAPVYFPGTTREAEATLVPVGSGDEQSGLDFQLQTFRPVRVEGTVAVEPGAPPLAIQLSTAGGPLRFTMTARTASDGRFSFSNVSPGTYTLVARAVNPGRGGGAAGPSNAVEYAATTIEVGDANVSGLQLPLMIAPSISGRLVFSGTTAAPDLAGRQVPLRSLTPDVSGALMPVVSNTDASGAFTISNVTPGQYVLGGPLFFGANADSVTWSLSTVVADGRDVTDLPLPMSDAPPKQVVVTYGDTWQQVTGRIGMASGAPAPDYTVIIFPADRAYWLQGSRRILTTHPASDGRFTLSGPGPGTLPPGSYLLAAVTELDRDEQYDPSLLATLAAGAVPVTLAPGDRKTQDLIVK